MKSNSKFALSLVAALAAIALALWWTRQQQLESAPRGQPARQNANAAPPTGPAIGASEAPTAVAAPVAPTEAALGVLAGPRGEFVIHNPADGERALTMAAETVGDPRALADLRTATWRLYIGGALQWSGELVADSRGGAILRQDETRHEIGWQGGVCWMRRGDAVLPCMRPHSTLVRAMQWLHWLLSAQALAEAPWRVVKGTTGPAPSGSVRANAVVIEGGPNSDSGVVFADPVTHRMLGAELPRVRRYGGPVDLPESVTDHQMPLHTELWLDDPRPFGGAQVASLARIKVDGGAKGPDALVVRVVEVRSGGVVPARPPELTLPKGLRVGPRLGGPAPVYDVGSHDQVDERSDQAREALGTFWLHVAFDVVEAFGPLGGPADSGVQLWLWPTTQAALVAPGLAPLLKTIPTEAAAARKYVQVTTAGVPAALQVVQAEVEAAGHKLAHGRRATAHYVAFGATPTSPFTIEFVVPIEPPP